MDSVGFRRCVKVPFSCLEGFVVQFGFQFFVVRNLAHSLHEILLYHVVTLSTYSKHTCNTHKAGLMLWTPNQSVWLTNVHTRKPWTELFLMHSSQTNLGRESQYTEPTVLNTHKSCTYTAKWTKWVVRKDTHQRNGATIFQMTSKPPPIHHSETNCCATDQPLYRRSSSRRRWSLLTALPLLPSLHTETKSK